MDKPIEPKIINPTEAKISNLTKEELKYKAMILMIKTKTRLLVFRSIVFLEKRNHIPIIPKIMKTETKMYDVDRSVVACSETESVSGSKVVRNGLAALRYLNPGRLIIPLVKTPTIEIIIEPRSTEQFRI